MGADKTVVIRKRVPTGRTPRAPKQGTDPRNGSVARQRPDEAGGGHIVRHNCGQEVDMGLPAARAGAGKSSLEDLPKPETPSLAGGTGHTAHEAPKRHAGLASFGAETSAGNGIGVELPDKTLWRRPQGIGPAER